MSESPPSKTTAAIGLAVRAVGRGMKVGVTCFGEHRALERLGPVLIYGWLALEPVVAARAARPAPVHVAITGRRCPQPVIDIADTVTEMNVIKHAFAAGIPAQQGIEH